MEYKIFLFNDDNYDIRLCKHDETDRTNGENIVIVYDSELANTICDALNDAYKRGFNSGRILR